MRCYSKELPPEMVDDWIKRERGEVKDRPRKRIRIPIDRRSEGERKDKDSDDSNRGVVILRF